MSDFDDFLKLVSDAKQQSPIAQKVKEVKTNLKEDLGDLFSQLSVVKEQDPVQQKHKKIEKEVKESVKSDLSFLFAQLSDLKQNLEEELVIEEAKLVEIQETAKEEILNEVTPIPALPKIKSPEQRIKDTNADVDKYLTGKTFQQPDPDTVSKNVEDIRNKLKFLEQAIGRIAAAGPGGGEVNLRWLDDIDRSTIGDNKYLRYNDTTKKFEFATVAVDAQDPLPDQTGNGGKYLTTDGTNYSWADVISGTAIVNDTSTNSNLFPLFTTVTTGTIGTGYVSNTKFTFNPSTGNFYTPTYSGNVTGNVAGIAAEDIVSQYALTKLLLVGF